MNILLPMTLNTTIMDDFDYCEFYQKIVVGYDYLLYNK